MIFVASVLLPSNGFSRMNIGLRNWARNRMIINPLRSAVCLRSWVSFGLSLKLIWLQFPQILQREIGANLVVCR
jgi:hypothetical protein